FVIAAVVQRRLHVDHLVTGEHAAFEGFLDPLLDRLDVLARDDAADDGVDEFKADARLRRLDPDFGVTVLAAATGLAHELADAFRRSGDRLAVSDLRTTDVGINAELALQAVNDDLKVELAHAADDRLAGLLIGRDLEARVFCGQPLKADAELLLILARLRLDGLGDDRRGKFERFENHGMRLFADGVAGRHLLEASDGDDLASGGGIDVFALVGVHAHDATDTLFRAARRVQRV